LFQPLLYQVATAALPPTSIASPLRRVLRRQANAEVILARVTAIDLAARRVKLEQGELSYDRLILAAGSTDSYFGHDDWAAAAPGLKSLGQALEIRNRVLIAFEAAEREEDPVRREALLTFVVVGGGPTGVELAGALSEIARSTLDRDFRRIQPAEARVVLVEAGPRVLASFDPKLSARAVRDLKRLGVELLTASQVTRVDAEGVTLQNGEREQRLASRTVIWAAGVKASPLGATLGVPLDRSGRVLVQPDLSLAGYPEVQVIGDLAALTVDGTLVPGLAPAAIQEGAHAAKNMLRSLKGQAAEPFRYWGKGTLATIGRGRAVAQIGPLRLSGLVAWLTWVFVHILYLVGFRNRYFVLTEWAFAYFMHDRGARLITAAGNDEPRAPAGPPAPPRRSISSAEGS
jgi:NADH dehydrogenase